MSQKRISLLIISGLILCISTLSAQIKGKVIDAGNKEPIIGASIKIVGTTLGGITNMDGVFQINTKEKKATIEVRYIGYKTEKVNWDSSNKDIIISIQEDSKELNEVVVIGYGVQKKSDLTGSISSIKADDIKTIPATSAVQALQGKASGVEVVRNSGSPGSSTSVRIRGMGTVNNSEPLYVVDGIPMDDMDYLSPDDIESIEILKDASSAAIYGSRAANGVVLVTTRSGKNSKKKFNLNLNITGGFQDVIKDPDVMNKNDYAYFYDYAKNEEYYTRVDPATNQVMIAPDTQSNMADWNDWWSLIKQKGGTYKANLAIFGGDKNLNYYLSGGIQSTDGIVKRSNYQRKNINLKINTKILDNLSLGGSFGYTREDWSKVPEPEAKKGGIVTQAIIQAPDITIFDQDGNYRGNTPVDQLNRLVQPWDKNTMVGQVNLDWDIIKDLKFSTRASYYQHVMNKRPFTISNANQLNVSGNSFSVSQTTDQQQSVSWDNILTYMKTFNKAHNLNVMVGQTMEVVYFNRTVASGSGVGGLEENFNALNLVRNGISNSGYSQRSAMLGLLGRISYDYKGKYLFQTNFRADASSKFSADNRWGFFPSVSGGWKISGESFMEDVTWVSLLKLRAGWGQLGNNRIDNYMNYTLIGNAGEYIIGTGQPGISPAYTISQYGDASILWERTQSTSVGIDFNMFNNRFSSSVEYFMKDTKDMLLKIPIVNMSGFTNVPIQNAGTVRNNGWEIQATWKDQINNWRYEVGGNITFIKNRVTGLGQGNEPIFGAETSLGYVNRTIVDAPIAAFYGWKTNGLMKPEDFDSQGKPLVPVFYSSSRYLPGDTKFVDVNGDGILDENDRTYIGSPLPTAYYGGNINIGYKNFDLSLFFQGIAGNDIYNYTKKTLYTDGTNVASDYFKKVYRPEPGTVPASYRDHWGGNVNGIIPSLSAQTGSNFRNSDFYIEDGSYFRLKSVQLTYTLPKKMCTRTKIISNLKVYANVSNLFTITQYSGIDPEVGTTTQAGKGLLLGYDGGVYPQSRIYNLGVIIDF